MSLFLYQEDRWFDWLSAAFYCNLLTITVLEVKEPNKCEYNRSSESKELLPRFVVYKIELKQSGGFLIIKIELR